MNKKFKGILLTAMLAAGIAGYGAEQVWNFDKTDDVAKATWTPKGKPGFVNGGVDIDCKNGVFGYVHDIRHCYFNLNFYGKIFDAAKYNILEFKVYASAPGKMILYYIAPGGEMASMDAAIEISAGWNEYEIEFNEQKFGKGYHSKASEGKKYQEWGGGSRKVSGLRLDPWFKKGTTVKFDYIKLITDEPEDSVKKKPRQ